MFAFVDLKHCNCRPMNLKTVMYTTPCRPSTYGQWNTCSLERALSELDRGTITSIRRASLMYGIPRSTLHDHYSGKVKLYAKPGPNPYLNLEEEEELSTFLIRCSRIEYPKTRQPVLGIVQEIVSRRQKDVTITNGWWERFSKRHPQVSLRTSVQWPMSVPWQRMSLP